MYLIWSRVFHTIQKKGGKTARRAKIHLQHSINNGMPGEGVPTGGSQLLNSNPAYSREQDRETIDDVKGVLPPALQTMRKERHSTPKRLDHWQRPG